MYKNRWGEVPRAITFEPGEWEWIVKFREYMKGKLRFRTSVIRDALRLYMLVYFILDGVPCPPSAEKAKPLLERILKEARVSSG
jgi:hypothetical protein